MYRTMNKEIRIARKIAREFIEAASHHSGKIANELKQYNHFSGKIEHPSVDTIGYVANADFTLTMDGIVFESGIWKQGKFIGTFKNGVFKSGVFKDGVWENGKWINGEWKGGKWQKGFDKDGKFHRNPPTDWFANMKLFKVFKVVYGIGIGGVEKKFGMEAVDSFEMSDNKSEAARLDFLKQYLTRNVEKFGITREQALRGFQYAMQGKEMTVSDENGKVIYIVREAI